MNSHRKSTGFWLLALVVFGLTCLPAWALSTNLPPGKNFDLSHWKLTLPVNATNGLTGSPTNIAYNILTNGYTNAPYFLTSTNDGAMIMQCPAVGASNSLSAPHSRCELREQVTSGSDSVNWRPDGVHILDVTNRVTYCRAGCRTVIGQVHGHTPDVVLVIMKFDPGTNALLDPPNLECDVYDTTNGAAFGYHALTFTNVAMNTDIAYRLMISNGLASITVNGSNQMQNFYATDSDWTNVTCYFKAGNYYVDTNYVDGGSPSSNFTQVKVYGISHTHAPAITGQPASQTNYVTSNITFSVTANGTTNLTYQWQYNSANLSGATNTSFTTNNVSVGSSGNYRVIVTDATLGPATSSVAALTIWARPTVSAPTSAIVTNGLTTNFTVTVTGTPTPSIQWQHAGTNLVNNGTYSGVTSSVLTIANPQSTEGGAYTVIATSPAGSATNSATLTVYLPAAITASPTSLIVAASSNATFNVTATGSPLAYQWYFNTTTALSGQTNAQLTLANVLATNAGSYSVAVSNIGGSVTSSVATLTVNYVDDKWADGSRANNGLPVDSAWYTGTAGELTATTGAMTGTTTNASAHTWWTYFTATTNNPVQLAVGQTLRVTVVFTPYGVNAINNTKSMRWGLYNDSLGVRQTADGTTLSGTNAYGYLVNMNFGQTVSNSPALQLYERTNITGTALMSGVSGYYSTVVSGGLANGSPGFSNGIPYALQFSVTRSSASSVDVASSFADANGWSTVTNATSSTAYVTSGFDTFAIRPQDAAGTATNFVFSEFKVEVFGAGGGGAYVLPPAIIVPPASLTVTNGDPAVFSVTATGTGTLTYQWQLNGSDLAGETSSTLTVNPAGTNSAGNYTVIVANSAGSVTSSAAGLTVLVPPTSTTPASLTVTNGNNAVFSVTANGTAPLTYQWQHATTNLVNNATFSGVTSNVLTITGAQLTEDGGYTVIVTNSAGSTSKSATLTVRVAPSISSQPTSLTVTNPAGASFSVTASGTPSPAYQWRFNGANIIGATSASYNIASAVASDAGDYTVVITNAAGSITSSIATLTVIVPVAITVQPVSAVVKASSNATFSVTATGSPLAYQWYLNTNSAISGATSSVLTLSGVGVTNVGAYSVVVSNTAGAVTSSVVALTVTVVDDTWADGTRTNTSLPVDSAWFASVATTITTATNGITCIVTNSTSREWRTYFTTNPASAVPLAVGQTIQATVNFTAKGINASNSGKSLRWGFYNSTGGTRYTSDGTTTSGTNILGYLINLNFGQTFNNSPQLQLMEHTNLSGAQLMSTVNDYTMIGSGGPTNGSPGFSNNVPYTLRFSVTRNASSVDVTTSFADTNNWSLSVTTNSSGAYSTFNFDTFIIRALGDQTGSATNIIVSEFKVAVYPAGPTNFSGLRLAKSIFPGAEFDVLSTRKIPGGELRVTLRGLPYTGYVVDCATNPAGPWQLDYMRLNADGEGQLELRDTTDGKTPVRYYRVRRP